MDPSDDCSFWYVGDYLKRSADTYSTRIGAFRMPDCLQGSVSGTAYYDLNHDGRRESGEPGLAKLVIQYSGAMPGRVVTDAGGTFKLSLPADPAYQEPTYTISQDARGSKAWRRTKLGDTSQTGVAIAQNGIDYTVHLADTHTLSGIDFGNACTLRNQGGRDVRFWSTNRSDLAGGQWQVSLINLDGSRTSVSSSDPAGADELRKYLRHAGSHGPSALSAQLAATTLNVKLGKRDGQATVYDPVENDWTSIDGLLERASKLVASRTGKSQVEQYRKVLEDLNRNRVQITPSRPEDCGPPK
jgi:hypothetical protein